MYLIIDYFNSFNIFKLNHYQNDVIINLYCFIGFYPGLDIFTGVIYSSFIFIASSLLTVVFCFLSIIEMMMIDYLYLACFYL